MLPFDGEYAFILLRSWRTAVDTCRLSGGPVTLGFAKCGCPRYIHMHMRKHMHMHIYMYMIVHDMH